MEESGGFQRSGPNLNLCTDLVSAAVCPTVLVLGTGIVPQKNYDSGNGDEICKGCVIIYEPG
jgi:hypothetical protein